MMIDLTVKTLDSQNHAFSLNDDINVRQFKEHIAETVNIAADLQRLIYCGRVLQDEKQLSEYDVNGKVIHLVQRAPPSSTHRSNSSSQSQSQSQSGDWPPTPRIHYRQAQFHGNPMYVGSVSIPADVLEGYDFQAPQLGNSMANNHLSVIRRMLDQANRVIDRLENPTGSTTTSSSTENTPSNTPAAAPSSAENDDTVRYDTASSSTSSATTTHLASETPVDSVNDESSSTPPSNDTLVPRDLAELLSNLLNTQDRLRPFIRDRMLSPETTESTSDENQRIIDGVSECFHFLSHAQHAMSNLTVNMQQPAPRTLRCRPMILGPSAILQAGVPIQVEAHISLHGQADGNSEGEESTNSTNRTPTGPTQNPPTNATSATSAAEPPGASSPPESRPTSAGQSAGTNPADSGFPPVFNFPNNVEVVMEMGPQAPRVWSFSTNDQNSGSNNNNNNNTANNNNSGSAGTNNGGNGAGPFPWGGTPTPDIIRNLMQAVAGYMAQTGAAPTPTPATTTNTSSSNSNNTTPIGCLRHRTVAVAVGDSGGSSGQNSQTRGNTETHPTTSTQTRTTSRTHVIHQHAQALGVGMGFSHSLDFDPFLNCNSYYIRRQAQATTNTAASTQTGQGRESNAATTQSQSSSTSNGRPRVATFTGLQLVDNLFNNVSLADSINNAESLRPTERTTFNTVLLNRGINFMSDNQIGPTPNSIIWLIYSVLGRVTVNQWFRWLNGDVTPMNAAIIDELRRKLAGRYGNNVSTTPNLIAHDIIRELRPHLERTFDGENATDRTGRAVDIRVTVEKIIETYVQKAAQLLIDEGEPIVKDLIVALKVLGRDLNAVLRFSLRGGESGLERVVARFATEMTRGTHELFREWILGTVVEWFCNYSRSVATLSDAEIISLLTYKDDLTPVATTSTETPRNQPQSAVEPMEVDSASNDRSNNDPLLDDGEEVPTTFPGHENILPDWVPIIARDGSRQRRQLQLGLSDGNVTTLSDAYLATMPSKRRKLVEQQKPSLLVSPTSNHTAIPSSMERLVRESVGRAGVEEVDGAVAALVADPTVRIAFGQAIRESLNPRRYQTPDFPDPLRFPNATKFFNDSNRPPKQ